MNSAPPQDGFWRKMKRAFSKLFETERQKISIVSAASLLIGLILYANETVQVRALRLQAATPFTYRETREYRGDTIGLVRNGFERTRIILSNDFDQGVILDAMTMRLLVTKLPDYTPPADCSLSDAEETRVNPTFWDYDLTLQSVDGMRSVEGGRLLQGKTAVFGVAPTSTPSKATQLYVRHEDQRRGMAPGQTIVTERDPFDQLVEMLEAPDGDFQDGTAWACLTVSLQRIGKRSESATILLAKVPRPFRPTTRESVALEPVEQGRSLDAGDRDVTRAFALSGAYSDTGADLVRERSLDLLLPLENLR
ncbi:hypothetical protein [Novosphingobium sp. AP12]|uniref:hypothetical protein n=1 Tax=Novosphingobium sp. AP12 TaxID=1144305 RepID=UPI000271E1FF|nr:hypothetical protein [Novosphingobium sp. AP12]EJL34455.1 hypothetical protein PMI02_00601 [Novosphingobium sp. AP12]